MIITVTMNPAIDKTIETDRLCPGALHRIRNMAWDAGGKGINVSKTIRELGEKSIATGFLGGRGPTGCFSFSSGQFLPNKFPPP